MRDKLRRAGRYEAYRGALQLSAVGRMRMGVRGQVLLALLLVTVGATGSVGLLVIWQTRQALAADRLETMASSADAARALVAETLERRQGTELAKAGPELERIWPAMVRGAGAREAALLLPDGSVLFPVRARALPEDPRGAAAAFVGMAPHPLRRAQAEGEHLLYARVDGGDRPRAVLRLSFELERSIDDTLWNARTSVLVFGLLNSSILLLGAALILRSSIVRPVVALERAAAAVAKGDLDARVEHRGPGELGQLADAFDQMTRSLRESRESLIRSETLASVGRVAAGIAHEVGNPLAAILGYVEMLLREAQRPLAADTRQDILTRVRAETQRIHKLIQELLEFSRPQREPNARTGVREVVDVASHLAKASGRAPTLEFDIDLSSDLPMVVAAPGPLTQVFLNLFLNAADAMPHGGRVSVRGRVTGDRLLVVVNDEGLGIDASVQKRIFEPFFTTKDPGKGTGLGLAVSRSIVESMGGALTVVPSNKGATFELELVISPIVARV